MSRDIQKSFWEMVKSSKDTMQPFAWGTFFSPDERRFLTAACDRLIPGSDIGGGALRAGVPQFIDRHMTSPFGQGLLWYRKGPFVEAPRQFGYQGSLAPCDILRKGIAETGDYCRDNFDADFWELSDLDQVSVLEQLENDELPFEQVAPTRFFTMLLAETRNAYFSDPVHGANVDMNSWRMIGYPGFPVDYRAAIRERSAPHPQTTRSISEFGKR